MVTITSTQSKWNAIIARMAIALALPILTTGCIIPQHQTFSSPLWRQSFQAARQDLFSGDEQPILLHPSFVDGFDSLPDFANAFGYYILGTSEFEYDPLPLDGALEFGKDIGATHVIVFQRLMGSDVENRINTMILPTTSYQSGSGLSLHSGMAFGTGYGLAGGPYSYMGSYLGHTTSSYTSTSIQSVPYTYSQRILHNVYRYSTVYLRRKPDSKQDSDFTSNPDNLKNLEQSANAGNAWSMLLMASVWQSGFKGETNTVEAVSWIQKSADAGNIVAMEMLSHCLEEGFGIPQNHDQALFWLKRAAQCGNTSAMIEYGNSLVLDDPTNELKATEAADWWFKGFEAGNPIAMFNLGICYLNGTGRRQSASSAKYFFSRANEAGSPELFKELSDMADTSNNGWYLYAISICYEYGVWTPKNHQNAEEWLNKARKNGCQLILHYSFDWLSI